MRRLAIEPRPDWKAKVEALGLTFHANEHDGSSYWDETACYQLTAAEVHALEAAGNELHARCVELIPKILANPEPYGLEQSVLDYMRLKWQRDEFSLYGRFDFAYDDEGRIKLLEYNADTPTSLYEAAVVQWQWLQDRFPNADQFNSIHEDLIERWKRLPGERVHFAALADNAEDWLTLTYLADTCAQAGHGIDHLAMEEIGWNQAEHRFKATDEQELNYLFKLYPWEWLWREQFGAFIPQARTQWIEPPWKQLLSSKIILPLLWQTFPDHPHLLPAYFNEPRLTPYTSYVAKPIYGREGANVTIVKEGAPVAVQDGPYHELHGGRYIYQAYCERARFDGHLPLFGVWMVGDQACGLGIREEDALITTNFSRFTPHYFTED